MNYLDILLRWMHIFPALIVVGGLFYIRFALIPSSGVLPEQERITLREGTRNLWAKWVHASIAFLLVSGFVNFYLKVKEYDLPSLYHAIWGTKVLLALVLMGLASVYVGRSRRAQAMRQTPYMWLNTMLVLAILIVAMSGILRTIDLVKKDPTPDNVDQVTWIQQ
jgi:uncharacterized membrane protein